VTVCYPEFGDFCDVAADVLGTTPEQIARFPNAGLAESALAAPRAGFGDVEVYPTILEKAAILLESRTPSDGDEVEGVVDVPQPVGRLEARAVAVEQPKALKVRQGPSHRVGVDAAQFAQHFRAAPPLRAVVAEEL
jgi:hypothetical protein